MSNASTTEPIPRGPTRAVGFLNLVFGGFLTLAGVAFLFVFVPFLRENNPLQLDPVDTRFFIEEMRRTTAGQLQEQERATSNPAAKADLVKAREKLVSQGGKIEDQVDFAGVNQDLPWISRYLWVDLLSAPLLSALLALSGVGLIFCKEWGRRLAVIVAGLKMLRLLGLAVFLLAVVVPHAGRVFRAFAKSSDVEALIAYGLGQVKAQGMASAQITANDFAEILVALGQGYALLMFFLGIIYPLIVVVVLTRSSARAACSELSEGDR